MPIYFSKARIADGEDGLGPYYTEDELSTLRSDLAVCRARCEALESALAGEKAAREHDRSVRFAFPKVLEDSCPNDIRALGWAVAVHNDYKLNGVKHTFWLFTKGDRNLKGEGLTDAEALNEVRAALAATREERGRMPTIMDYPRHVPFA